MVNGCIGQVGVRVLPEQVSLIAFAVRRDNQLRGFFRPLMLPFAMVDEAKVLLHSETRRDVLVEKFARIELRLQFGNSKPLRHDLDHAEGVPDGGFPQGEPGMRACVDNHNLGAVISQDGSQHAAFETCTQNRHIELSVHLAHSNILKILISLPTPHTQAGFQRAT